MSHNNRKSEITFDNVTSDRLVESLTDNIIAANGLMNLPIAVDILTASEVDMLLCSEFACAPASAKRWRLSDPSFPKPCTPRMARPRWRRADVLEWIESL